MVELEFLRELGFTDGEMRVYDALLSLGPSPSGKITKKSGISSSKVYPILDRLSKKGMATYVVRSGVKHFQASDPRKLLELLEERKKFVEKQKKDVEKMLPGLMARMADQGKGQEAEVYEGYGGVKSYFMQALRDSKPGDERVVFGAVTGYPLSEPAQRFFRFYDRQRAKAGIKVKVIYSEEARKQKESLRYRKSELTKVRYVPQVSLSSVGIQKDSVDILIWTKETSVLFVIRSREVADTFRTYFNILWKTAKK